MRSAAMKRDMAEPAHPSKRLKRINGMLFIALGLMMLAGYMGLAIAAELGPALLLVPAVILPLSPLGETLDRRFPAYRFVSGVLALAAAIGSIGAAFVFGLLNAVTWLVMFIQAYKLLHGKQQRDYGQAALMSFFLLVCACAQDPGPAIALSLGLFILSSAVFFVLLNVRNELVRAGAEASAELSALDQSETGMTSAHTRQLSRLSTLEFLVGASFFAVYVVAVTVGLFLLTPRVQAGFLGRNRVDMATTGLSDGMNLAAGGLISPDPSPVMRVEFPGEPNGAYDGPLYWRATTLDTYSAGAWDRIGISQQGFDDATKGTVFFRPYRNEVERAPNPAVSRVVRQVIYVDSDAGVGLPCLPLPLEASSQGANLVWDPRQDFTVSMEGGRNKLHYEALSEVAEFTPEQLRSAPSDYEDVLPHRTYFVLTEHSLSRASVALARRIVQDAAGGAGSTTVYDAVSAIQDYLLSDEYRYSLDLPSLPPHTAVDAFLHRTKEGHCELFASAMTLMVRSLGIPARLVKGYRGGDWNEGDRSYVVRKSMAHAWVEVYFIDCGWVTFDPSPPAPPESASTMAWLRRTVSRYTLTAKMLWYREVVGYEGGIRWGNIRNIALGIVGGRAESGSPRRGPTGALPLRTILIVLALLALWLFLRIHARLRPPAPTHVTKLDRNQKRAVRLYRTLKRQLTRAGTDCRGKTAEEILESIGAKDGRQLDAVREVIRAYNEARFGGGALPPSEYASLSARVRALRAARQGAAGVP